MSSGSPLQALLPVSGGGGPVGRSCCALGRGLQHTHLDQFVGVERLLEGPDGGVGNAFLADVGEGLEGVGEAAEVGALLGGEVGHGDRRG